VLFLATSVDVTAQSLQIADQTPNFTDYVITNDSLQSGPPIDILIPYYSGNDVYRVLEQVIVPVSTGKPTYKQKSVSSVQPLIQVVSKGIYRKRPVASLHIRISRPSTGNKTLITKYLKIRVYKSGYKPKSVLPKTLNDEFGVAATQKSPLATGTWYKIPVRKNGIYKITSSYLSDLGIDVNNIDPRKIQIWGTDGYELPHPNSTPRPQFKQIPIIVKGESDGQFNNNDYILFYGNSPNRTIYNSNSNSYSHRVHPYSNYNYVFLTVADQNGERLKPSNNGLTANRTINTFRDFIWKEQELTKSESDMKSGTQWLGQTFTNESFARTQSVFQDTIPGIIQNQPADFQIRFAAQAETSTIFYANTDSKSIGQVYIQSINNINGETGYSAHESTLSATVSNFTADKDIINVNATFSNSSSGAKGWLDWIQINIDRKLTPKNGRLYFFSPHDGQSGDIGNYVLTGFSEQPVVMDVTDPVNPKLLSVTASNKDFDCIYNANPGLQLIAQTTFYAPEKGTVVPNQDLHAISDYPNYIIVTNEKFLDQAKQLANYRKNHNGLRPLVVTQSQIFNEYSGGVPDPVAIRDFMRFLYLRAGNNTDRLPEYLLLFGNTTYDYKGIVKDAKMTNYVFTYESEESLQRIDSFASDDYYGLLDNNEGTWKNDIELLDIGVGRIPVQTVKDAETALNKIESYDNTSDEGDWKTLFTFVADDDYPNPDQNRDLHVLNADSTASIVENSDEGLHVNKIYEFSYPVENTTAGRRIPQATDAFINSINNGTLVINYSGHGAEQVLSDERLFVSNYVNRFHNKNKLSIFVTATCQFGRYDDTDQQSGAEQTVFWPDGGMAAAFTTTRVVYTSSDPNSLNFGLNRILTRYMSSRNPQTKEPRTLGNIYRLTKITGTAGPSFNSRKFILLGDPAMRIGLPQRKMNITSINNVTNLQDTTLNIRALDHVNIQGNVINSDSTVNTGFDGQVNIRVYDASRYVKLPDRSWEQTFGCFLKNCRYKVQNDILFNGRASVKNGHFTANFIVPKDISYSGKKGKILLYAQEPSTDASGEFADFTLGGTNPNAASDKKGPKMDVYLNNQTFMDGSLVNNSPKLIVDLKDPSGINTTGTGVGHQLIAKLDSPDKPEKTIVLNDYYTSNLNDFTSGKIVYPFDNLANGDYTLTIRAWDVYNNPSTSEISFKVAQSNQLTIRRVYNFPNPMNNKTRFIIEHNQPGNPMNVNIRIYTLSGRPVAHIERDDIITSSPYVSIDWFGRDDDNDRLATGTYLYTVRVKADTPKGEQSVQKIEKLVIIH